MFRLFKRKKNGTVSAELPICGYSDVGSDSCETLCPPSDFSDSKMARLMELIGGAIEDWATEYHLENLPKKIVLEQALDAMEIMKHVVDRQEG